MAVENQHSAGSPTGTRGLRLYSIDRIKVEAECPLGYFEIVGVGGVVS
jgi:hypothetical protein